MSRDPIGYRGSKWNLYEYIDSNPCNGHDPFGFGWLWNTCGTAAHIKAHNSLKERLRGMCKECDAKCDHGECGYVECMLETDAIAMGIFRMLENNWKFDTGKDPYQGYLCWQWATGYDFFINELSHGCFRSVIRFAYKPFADDLHYWIKITSPCSGGVVYVDDQFGFNDCTFVHSTPPVPDGYVESVNDSEWQEFMGHPVGCNCEDLYDYDD